MGLAVLLIINVIFLIDTELAIQRNPYQHDTEKSQWTFGQTLAILLLAMPLRDLVEMIAEKREEQRKDEHTKSLQDAIKEESKGTIKSLIERGANINIKVTGMITVNRLKKGLNMRL
jgi:hypothetical protein